MFLVLKQRIVAHGDDDWYTFEVLDPVGVVNNQEEAERYLAYVEAEYQAAVIAHNEGLEAHKRAWEDLNPKPVNTPFCTMPKWGVLKNADITPEMRAEREAVRQRNKEIERENNRASVRWLNRFMSAETRYLAQHKPPKKQHLEIRPIKQLFVPSEGVV